MIGTARRGEIIGTQFCYDVGSTGDGRRLTQRTGRRPEKAEGNMDEQDGQDEGGEGSRESRVRSREGRQKWRRRKRETWMDRMGGMKTE